MTLPTTTMILAVLLDRPAGATTLDICKELARRLPVGSGESAIDMMNHVALKLRTLELSGRVTGTRLDYYKRCTWALPVGVGGSGVVDLHAGQDAAADGGGHGNLSPEDSLVGDARSATLGHGEKLDFATAAGSSPSATAAEPAPILSCEAAGRLQALARELAAGSDFKAADALALATLAERGRSYGLDEALLSVSGR